MTVQTETRRVDELRLLEAEAVHIIREVVAELRAAGAAVLRRQGFDRATSPGGEGFSSSTVAVSVIMSTPDTTSPRSSSSGTAGLPARVTN